MLFVSGGSALVFQVAWMRELRLVFGATTAAVAAVLAIFMARAGAWGAPCWAGGPIGPPIRCGCTACSRRRWRCRVAVSPLVVWLAATLYFRLGGQESLGLDGATVVRLLLAAAVMGVPTFLMGGTLPAAVRSITTAGDVAAAGAGGALRREHAGSGVRRVLRHVLRAGVARHAGHAVVRLRDEFAGGSDRDLACRSECRRLTVGEVASGDESAVARQRLDSSRRWLYATAAVLGFTFFTLELVWYRMLAPILGGTTFTFGLILCVALLGIGVGGAAYHFVFRWLRPSWSVLALTCAAEAALAALPFALGDRLALLAGRLVHAVRRRSVRSWRVGAW